MGSRKPLQGVYARETSILISFQWRGKRFRETVHVPPTPANLKYAARLRTEIERKIELGTFSFSEFFPESKTIEKLGLGNDESPTFEGMALSWLDLIKPDLAATTAREYYNTLHRHFISKLGAMRMRDFTTELVQKHLASIEVHTAKSYNNAISPFRMVLAKAWEWKKTSENLAAAVKNRKRKNKPEPDPLSVQEVESVLAKMRERYDEQVPNYFEFAFFTGLRPSELIALTWSSVDFSMRSVRVQEARVRGIDKDTKTHTVRDVRLRPRALAVLERQRKHTYLLGGKVFFNPITGKPYPDTQFQMDKFWVPALKSLAIRHRDARQTRHTYATMSLMAGIKAPLVAKQMGHTNTKMFFEVYSKWIEDDEFDERELAKLDDFVTDASLDKKRPDSSA